MNGISLFSESEFNQDVYDLEKEITLTADNTLEIRLVSVPHSYLTIEVKGENCGTSDTTPPNLVITSPEDNKATTDAAITIAGTADDVGTGASGIAQVWVNNTTVPYSSVTKIWESSSLPLSPGTNVFIVRTVDNAGNESSSQVTVIQDLTQPGITIISPVSGAITLNQSLSVGGNASDGGTDASGLSRVTVNGIEAALNLVSGEWSLADLSLTVGANTITATAYDCAGNESSAQITISRTVNQPPIVSAGSDQTIELPNPLSLSGTATDDGYPIGSNVSLLWRKISGDGDVNFSNPNSLQMMASFSVQGLYVLRLSASDGQLSTSDELIVTVHPANQAPTVNAGADQVFDLPNAASLSGPLLTTVTRPVAAFR